jgi:hypothetical protein
VNAGQIGAKLAFYSEWARCTAYPNSTKPDPEFYDYNPETSNNTSELDNDYYSQNQTTQNTIAQYIQALGSWGPPGTGLIGTELNAPLIGKGRNGNALSHVLTEAQQAYFNFAYGKGRCVA